MMHKVEVRPNKPRDGRHCDLCGCSQPAVRCDKCGCQIFCLSCDDMYHRHPKRRFHLRKAVDPAPSTLQARPVLPMKVSHLSTSPGDPSKMPLPPPRKKKPAKSFFDTFRRSSPSSDHSPPLPKKEYSWTDRLGSIKKFMSNRPLPPLPANEAEENNVQLTNVTQRHDLSFIHKKVDERPPQLPQRSYKPTHESFGGMEEKENIRNHEENGINFQNGTNHGPPVQNNGGFSSSEENQWLKRTNENQFPRQLNTLDNRQNYTGFMQHNGPGYPPNFNQPLHQSISSTDLQNLPGMDVHHPMPQHYPHYPMNGPPHYPYPMYPQYPPPYFGNSFANISSQPNTENDFSDNSEASSRHHGGRRYPFRKKAKRSQSVMVDRMGYPGQFYPFGPYPPGYAPPPWGPPFQVNAPPSPASSIRSLNRVGRTRRRKKLTSEDDEEEFSMSSSPLSRPKSSSSERPSPGFRKAPAPQPSSSSDESDHEKEISRSKGSRASRRESDPRRLPSPATRSPQIVKKKTPKMKKSAALSGHSDADDSEPKHPKSYNQPVKENITNQTPPPGPSTPLTTPSGDWQCKHCTFLNSSQNKICQVCCKTASPAEEATTASSRPTSSSSRKLSLSSEKSCSSPEKRTEDDVEDMKAKQDMDNLNSALDEAEKEISRGIEELMKLKEDFSSQQTSPQKKEPSSSQKPPVLKDSGENSKPVYKSSGKMRSRMLDKLNLNLEPATKSASTDTQTGRSPSGSYDISDKIIEARRPSTSSTTSDAYNSPVAQSPDLEQTTNKKDKTTKRGSQRDSSCQTQQDSMMDYQDRRPMEDEPYLGRQINGFGYRYGDRVDMVTSPVPSKYDREFGGGFVMMPRSRSRASLFTGRINDSGPMEYGAGPSPMYRSVSRTSLTGDFSDNRFSEFHNLRKPDYYLSMEELVERRRQEHIRAQGLELVRMIREAEQQGFTADDIQIALSKSGNQNPLEWLQQNWKNMVENVINMSTNYGNEKKENDVGAVSEDEARDALRFHKGNIWAAVTECVESRQRKFFELKARGKFSSKAIVEALTATQGDVGLAYSKLTKSSSKPFLMRIWGTGEGAENQDGAIIPMEKSPFQSEENIYRKQDCHEYEVLSDDIWSEDEDVEWDDEPDEDDEHEQGDLDDLQTCREDLANDIITPESDKSDYADAFGTNTLERVPSLPSEEDVFPAPDDQKEKRRSSLLSKLAALRKDGSKSNSKAVEDDDDHINQEKSYKPMSIIRNTISAIRDTVSGSSKYEKKLPCAAPERRTIIVNSEIARDESNDESQEAKSISSDEKVIESNKINAADLNSVKRASNTKLKQETQSNFKEDSSNVKYEKTIDNISAESKRSDPSLIAETSDTISETNNYDSKVSTKISPSDDTLLKNDVAIPLSNTQEKGTIVAKINKEDKQKLKLITGKYLHREETLPLSNADISTSVKEKSFNLKKDLTEKVNSPIIEKEPDIKLLSTESDLEHSNSLANLDTPKAIIEKSSSSKIIVKDSIPAESLVQSVIADSSSTEKTLKSRIVKNELLSTETQVPSVNVDTSSRVEKSLSGKENIKDNQKSIPRQVTKVAENSENCIKTRANKENGLNEVVSSIKSKIVENVPIDLSNQNNDEYTQNIKNLTNGRQEMAESVEPSLNISQSKEYTKTDKKNSSVEKNIFENQDGNEVLNLSLPKNITLAKSTNLREEANMRNSSVSLNNVTNIKETEEITKSQIWFRTVQEKENSNLIDPKLIADFDLSAERTECTNEQNDQKENSKRGEKLISSAKDSKTNCNASALKATSAIQNETKDLKPKTTGQDNIGREIENLNFIDSTEIVEEMAMVKIFQKKKFQPTEKNKLDNEDSTKRENEISSTYKDSENIKLIEKSIDLIKKESIDSKTSIKKEIEAKTSEIVSKTKNATNELNTKEIAEAFNEKNETTNLQGVMSEKASVASTSVCEVENINIDPSLLQKDKQTNEKSISLASIDKDISNQNSDLENATENKAGNIPNQDLKTLNHENTLDVASSVSDIKEVQVMAEDKQIYDKNEGEDPTEKSLNEFNVETPKEQKYVSVDLDEKTLNNHEEKILLMEESVNKPSEIGEQSTSETKQYIKTESPTKYTPNGETSTQSSNIERNLNTIREIALKASSIIEDGENSRQEISTTSISSIPKQTIFTTPHENNSIHKIIPENETKSPSIDNIQTNDNKLEFIPDTVQDEQALLDDKTSSIASISRDDSRGELESSDLLTKNRNGINIKSQEEPKRKHGILKRTTSAEGPNQNKVSFGSTDVKFSQESPKLKKSEVKQGSSSDVSSNEGQEDIDDSDEDDNSSTTDLPPSGNRRSSIDFLRSRFEGLIDNGGPVVRPQSPFRRMSFNSRKAAIALERTKETTSDKPWVQPRPRNEPAKPIAKRTLKQQLEMERKVRKMVADRKCRTYRKAEIIVQLMEMNFEEEEAIQAANECSTLEQALSYLQQECLLCTGFFPVSQIISMIHCPHMACRECIRAYFTVQIRDRNIMELLCPFCNEPDLTDEDIAQDYFNHLDIMLKKLVDEEIHELFQRKLRDRVLMRDPSFRWCSKCSSGFLAMPNLKMLVCPDCNAVTCALCRRPWEKEHQGISCEAFGALKDAEDPEAQALGLAKLLTEDGISCPRCHFRYALAKGGCMHFRCIQCQHDFCSGCSKPFKMGQKCGVSEFCAKLGLHAHHPRNCLFYLRDKDPEDLQRLLDLSDVEYDTNPPDGMELNKACQVMEQKETADGMVDDYCGKEVEIGFAGLCRLHYVEYLGQLVNKNRVDPIQIFEKDDLELVLRRANVRLPARKYRETDDQYRERLVNLIQAELPLDKIEGS